jgi:hypothetical protein
MELFSQILEKYGVKTAVLLFIVKTIAEWLLGSTKKFFKTIEENNRLTKENTDAILKLQVQIALQPKIQHDINVAFHNIKEIRDKSGMGSISMPEGMI